MGTLHRWGASWALLAALACGDDGQSLLPSPTTPPLAPPLTVVGIAPEQGVPGTIAEIRGTGFRSEAVLEVTFKNTFASIVAVDDTVLTVSVPEMPDGLAVVVVTTPGRRSDTSAFTFFTVLVGRPARPDRTATEAAQLSASCSSSAAADCSGARARDRAR